MKAALVAAVCGVIALSAHAETSRRTTILAVVVQYTDAANPATSIAAWNRALFKDAKSVRAFYAEGSGGTHIVSGMVLPRVLTLPQSRPDGRCRFPDMGLIVSAIHAEGIRLADYGTLVVSAVRSTGGCGQSFASSFQFADPVSKESRTMPFAMMWGAPSIAVVAHELGHTEGLGHASSISCGAVALGPACATKEYGNPFDNMGGSSIYQTYSAQFRARLRWIRPIVHTSGRATYTIGAAYTSGAVPNAIEVKVSKLANATVHRPVSLWIEYRAPFGWDARLLARAAFASMLDGAMVGVSGAWTSTVGRRTYSLNCGRNSCMMDMTPGDNTITNGALRVGSTWNDSFTGVTITVDSRTDKTMTVTVETGPQT